jgi:DNA invertase Pin-like site-specific DNA recombinase
MEVQVIDSIIKQRQLNVCAYARVSTNKDEQEAAIETQIDYYSELILSNPAWNYCGIYADEGITGTSMAKRVQFNKMIELALSGKIDIILCKSISRFARNTIDFKETIQKRTEANCEVIFEKENISSKDPKIEIFSSTLASIAQEESRSISENVKWGLKRKYQNNEFWINECQLIGYKYDENHKVVIDKSQEEIIRIIYEEYAKKTSVFRISKMLEKKGFLTPNKNHKWSASTIRSILRNEKYIGTVILQKKFVKSYKEKEVRIKNTGQKPMYVLENAVPAIIDKELFEKV